MPKDSSSFKEHFVVLLHYGELVEFCEHNSACVKASTHQTEVTSKGAVETALLKAVFIFTFIR
jgi:hypothetical protein